MSNKINITMAEREALMKEIHANAVAKGFWDEDHSEQHYLMLVITELSEAVEAHRRGDFARREGYQMALELRGLDFDQALFLNNIKDSVEDELADALIRIYDMMVVYKSYILEQTIVGKRNRARCEIAKHNNEFTAQVKLCIKPLFKEGYDMLYSEAIGVIEAVAEYNNIDIYWHVREKMKYNATRPHLHGKKY